MTKLHPDYDEIEEIDMVKTPTDPRTEDQHETESTYVESGRPESKEEKLFIVSGGGVNRPQTK